MGMYKITENFYKKNPEFDIYICCEIEILDINITELRDDIQAFKEYVVAKYDIKDEKSKKEDWFKFWKK